MKLMFTANGWSDYLCWREDDTSCGLERVKSLILQCAQTPFEGAGKPQALTGDFEGYWSRRIDRKHRLVYTVKAEQLIVLQCRFHH